MNGIWSSRQFSFWFSEPEMDFHLVHRNRKENCHHDHIRFDFERKWNTRFLSVYRCWESNSDQTYRAIRETVVSRHHRGPIEAPPHITVLSYSGGGSQLGSHDVRDVRLSVRFSRRAGFCSRSRNSRLSCGVLLRGSLKPLQHHGIMVTRGLKAALHFKFFKKNGKNPVYIFRCNFLQSLENENKGTGLHRWQEQTFSYSFFHSFLFHSENTYTPSNGLYFRSRFGS